MKMEMIIFRTITNSTALERFVPVTVNDFGILSADDSHRILFKPCLGF